MRSVLAVASGLLALLLGLAAPASAAPRSASADGLVTCPLGVQNTSYSPGLTFTTPAPHVALDSTGTLGPCVSLDLQHTAGTYHFSGGGNLNCLGGSSTGSGTVTWTNPGTSPSHFSYTSSLGLRPDGTTVLVATGPVTSGDYAGHTIISTIVITSTDLLACATPSGLTSTAGPFLVTVV